MFRNSRKPSPELAKDLQSNMDVNLALAAEIISKAEVLILITGAGFSADSGLALYADVANVNAYRERNLEYHDICQPHWLGHDPGLFYGFWGQCFNDYCMTQPHKGYEIVAKWRNDKNRGSVAKEMKKNVEAQEQSSLLEGEAVGDPYLVQGRAGAFFTFTSNVDAHSFDFFHAHEIRECHGNVELWQCQNSRCAGDNDSSRRIWRAPFDHHFVVDTDTMIAPRDPSSIHISSQTPIEDACAVGNKSKTDAAAHVGHVHGISRRQTLKYMLDGIDASNLTEWAETNWPMCRNCGKAARPAILMFGDLHWHDNDAQDERWLNWLNALFQVAQDHFEDGDPLKVAILEIGCGLNVATCRYQSEALVMQLEEKEADVKLVRINPDFPLVDNDDYIAADNVISIMARGLETLEKIDGMMSARNQDS